MDTIRREYVSLWSWAAERQERGQIAAMLETVSALADTGRPNDSLASIADTLSAPDAAALDELTLDNGRAA